MNGRIAPYTRLQPCTLHSIDRVSLEYILVEISPQNSLLIELCSFSKFRLLKHTAGFSKMQEKFRYYLKDFNIASSEAFDDFCHLYKSTG